MDDFFLNFLMKNRYYNLFRLIFVFFRSDFSFSSPRAKITPILTEDNLIDISNSNIDRFPAPFDDVYANAKHLNFSRNNFRCFDLEALLCLSTCISVKIF